jgi:hypothetical protein
MQLSPFLGRLALIALGLALFTLATLRADDNVDYHPALEDIHGLLKQAMGGDSGTPPDKAQLTDLLKKAQQELRDIPPERHWGGHRQEGLFLIQAALDAIAQGEPDDKVQGDIRDADSDVRDME